ncbi:MAG: sulfatase [Nitrospirae bacterium]|nr:sulfatase [Nitrospirota bacterium]
MVAFILWVMLYVLFKALSNLNKAICYEHIIAWFIIAALIIIVKKESDFSLKDLGNIYRLIILTLVPVIVTAVVWIGHKPIERHAGKILYKIYDLITPLVWIFAFLFIFAVPFSFFTFARAVTKADYVSNGAQVFSTDKNRPNIIFVSMDALGARDMQLYGYNRPTTPFITEWARNAVVFKRAYASSNWTPPATMSMMTGQRPWIHKNWHLMYLYPFRHYEQNLPKLLKDDGYATYAFVQNFNATADSHGIGYAFLSNEQYFTFLYRPPGIEGNIYRKIDFLLDKTNSPIAVEWVLKHPLLPIWLVQSDTDKTTTPPEMVYDSFLKHISIHPRQPFFAWLHLEMPHFPFLPQKPYMGMFGDGDKFNTEQKQVDTGLLGKCCFGPERQKEVDILKKRQDEFILYGDQQFKLFLSRLAETVDMSNTIIFFSSDHGTSMSRGYIGHGNYRLYENVTNIPLIIKMPDTNNRYKGINGTVIDVPVEQIDIAPTILELAGIPAPKWMEGRSLLSRMEGKFVEPRPVFSMELGRNSAIISDPLLTKYSIAIWDGDYKLIYYSGWEGKKTELFNLSTDPGETKNIFHEKPEMAKRFLKQIESGLSQATKRQYTLSE